MKKYALQILLLLFFSLFIYTFFPVNVIGSGEQICTVSTVADRDTYSDGGSHTSIRGTQQYLIAGYHNTSGEWHPHYPYIHFDLKDKPDNWTKAEIVLYYYDSVLSSDYLNGICSHFECVNITNNWNEETLNWNNQPDMENYLSNKIGEYEICAPRSNLIKRAIDISDHIKFILSKGSTEISIRLHRYWESVYIWGCKIRSREYSGSEKPTLAWTYLGHCPEPSPMISGYHVMVLLLSLGVCLFIICKRLKHFTIHPKK